MEKWGEPMLYASIDGHEAVSASLEYSALKLPNDPAVESAYLLAGGLMEILGPSFWTVLIGGFLFAEFWLG
jgi:hypothetical protein